MQRCKVTAGTGYNVEGIRLSRPFEKYSFLKRRSGELEHGHLVAKAIQKARPQAVISADTPLDAQIKILRASQECGARFIFWFQDAIGLATRRILRGKMGALGNLIGWYYERMERAMVRQSERVILISEDFLPLMDTWGVDRERVRILPNWAPLDEIPMQPKCNRWAVRHQLEDSFCFLFSGILGYKHNPGLFLRLAETFYGEAQVVVISEGGGADWLRDQQKAKNMENLVLFPFQAQEDFPAILGTGDILVSLLNQDAGAYSVPSKVLSYLCAGRPLLLSIPLNNQAAQLVKTANAGLAHAPDDTEGWLSSARMLMSRVQLRKEMGANARHYADRAFDIERITTEFEEILN